MDVKAAQFSPKVDAAATVQPLPGSVQVRFVRCGTAGCRCARGVLHGPYFRRVWREDGMTRARYVRLTDLDQTQRAVAAWQTAHPSLRALRRELRSLSRMLEEDGDGDEG